MTTADDTSGHITLVESSTLPATCSQMLSMVDCVRPTSRAAPSTPAVSCSAPLGLTLPIRSGHCTVTSPVNTSNAAGYRFLSFVNG